MIAEIEEAIVSLLTTQLSNARVKAQKGFEGIPQPGVYVSTEGVRFTKTTMYSWKQDLTIYVDVIFKSLNVEAQRRKGVYPILEGIVQVLFLQNLGLQIQPLEPKSFIEITGEEMLRDGLIAFTMELTTYFHVTLMPAAQAQELLRIGMSYYLEPSGIDEVTDVVNLPQS
jgi:hypothetical protein